MLVNNYGCKLFKINNDIVEDFNVDMMVDVDEGVIFSLAYQNNDGINFINLKHDNGKWYFYAGKNYNQNADDVVHEFDGANVTLDIKISYVNGTINNFQINNGMFTINTDNYAFLGQITGINNLYYGVAQVNENSMDYHNMTLTYLNFTYGDFVLNQQEITPLLDNEPLFLYDDVEIDFDFYTQNLDNTQIIRFKDQNDHVIDYKFAELLNNVNEGHLTFKKIDDKMKIILNNSTLLSDDDIVLDNLYGMSFIIGTDIISSNMDITNFVINSPYSEFQDYGVEKRYNTFMVEREDTTEVEYDIDGTSIQSTASNNRGIMIPTQNGDYNMPFIIHGSGEVIFDYYYVEDGLKHNGAFISNRIGNQNHRIYFDELGLTGNARIKIQVTNEYEAVGNDDANANIKVYVGEFGTDKGTFNKVIDEDISISIVRAGWYFGFIQANKGVHLKYKNFVINGVSYDYNAVVVCRGYDERGVLDDARIWESSVVTTVNTHDRKLVAKFSDVPNNVKYIDFVIVFNDENIKRLEISKIMLYDGLEDAMYTEDTREDNLDKITINFDKNYYCNYYNSSKNDPVGLSIIRPTFEGISLRKLPAPKITDDDGNQGVTVLYPYLKKADEENKPENVAIEYLNSTNQTIKLIYNG